MRLMFRRLKCFLTGRQPFGAADRVYYFQRLIWYPLRYRSFVPIGLTSSRRLRKVVKHPGCLPAAQESARLELAFRGEGSVADMFKAHSERRKWELEIERGKAYYEAIAKALSSAASRVPAPDLGPFFFQRVSTDKPEFALKGGSDDTYFGVQASDTHQEEQGKE